MYKALHNLIYEPFGADRQINIPVTEFDDRVGTVRQFCYRTLLPSNQAIITNGTNIRMSQMVFLSNFDEIRVIRPFVTFVMIKCTVVNQAVNQPIINL